MSGGTIEGFNCILLFQLSSNDSEFEEYSKTLSA